ncbi:hypothetical protein [Bacteroides sp. Marseille-P3684]|uniref:hypothetical protein n=1 Tax=Bacteroides sp. Marseille-P3684 TaxID=2086579 RepID=UPI000D0FFCC3|nr:hypothetical protein [Bacteroides sp. Marseille-P3684]
MLRGITQFKCTHCGKKFPGLDIEYAATFYTMPQRCPHCGSIRTRPAGWLGRLHEWVYRGIWEGMEEREKEMRKGIK